MEPIQLSYYDYTTASIKTETINAPSLTDAIAEFRAMKDYKVFIYSASYTRDPIKIIYK